MSIQHLALQRQIPGTRFLKEIWKNIFRPTLTFPLYFENVHRVSVRMRDSCIFQLKNSQKYSKIYNLIKIYMRWILHPHSHSEFTQKNTISLNIFVELSDIWWSVCERVPAAIEIFSCAESIRTFSINIIGSMELHSNLATHHVSMPFCGTHWTPAAV